MLLGVTRGQIYFCTNTKVLFAFFTVLTFAVKVQNKWEIKLLMPVDELKPGTQPL